MSGKIKIVNGEVVRDGADLEAGSQRGATTSSGSTSVGQAVNSLSSNSFVNNVSRYNKGAIAFLVVLALLGMRIAFPILMMVVLYNVFVVFKLPPVHRYLFLLLLVELVVVLYEVRTPGEQVAMCVLFLIYQSHRPRHDQGVAVVRLLTAATNI